MNLSIRQLRAFSAVAELGSFVEAARLLHVTPAALSALVRELEGTLGFRLFDRTTRRVVLSDPGRQYLQYAERVLADLHRAEQFAQDLRQQRTGVVRIATTAVMTWVLLPPLLRAFQQRWPKIGVELVDVPTHEIVSSVETGAADLAISYVVPVGEALEATPLFVSRVHAVLPAGHALAAKASLPWRALNDQPVIFIGRGSELRIRSELPGAVQLRSRHEVQSTITALALVASGGGVAVCAGYVAPMAALHGLACVPLRQPVIDRPFVAYRHRSRALSPAVETFREFLREQFAQQGARRVEDALPR